MLYSVYKCQATYYVSNGLYVKTNVISFLMLPCYKENVKNISENIANIVKNMTKTITKNVNSH